MENGAQEASMIVRVTFDGASRLIRITTDMPRIAMEMVRILQALERGPKEGQVNMRKMMETGSALKVIPVKGKENFNSFATGAKEYGVMYSVVEDTQKGIFDVVIREEDAARVNRIIERYEMQPENSLSIKAKEVQNVISANRNEQSEAFADRNKRDMDMRNPNLAPAEGLYGAKSENLRNSAVSRKERYDQSHHNDTYGQSRTEIIEKQQFSYRERTYETEGRESDMEENMDNIISFDRTVAPSKRRSVKKMISELEKEELAAAEKSPGYSVQHTSFMRPSDAFDSDMLEERKRRMAKSIEEFNNENNDIISRTLEYDKR